MKEVYLTLIPLQGKHGLEKQKYVFKNLDRDEQKNLETSFPIIPIINTNLDRDVEREIIAIRFSNNDSDGNWKLFSGEVEKLKVTLKERGDVNQDISVKDIVVNENQLDVIKGAFLIELLEKIDEESLVYADITYGTKPMTAMFIFALLMIEKIKFVDVKGLFYGEIIRNEGVFQSASLYDVTRLKQLYNALESFEVLGIDDKISNLKKLFDI